jgi:hypothetical protein
LTKLIEPVLAMIFPFAFESRPPSVPSVAATGSESANVFPKLLCAA